MIKRFLLCDRIPDCIHSTCRVYACTSAVYRILRALYYIAIVCAEYAVCVDIGLLCV